MAEWSRAKAKKIAIAYLSVNIFIVFSVLVFLTLMYQNNTWVAQIEKNTERLLISIGKGRVVKSSEHTLVLDNPGLTYVDLNNALALGDDSPAKMSLNKNQLDFLQKNFHIFFELTSSIVQEVELKSSALKSQAISHLLPKACEEKPSWWFELSETSSQSVLEQYTHMVDCLYQIKAIADESTKARQAIIKQTSIFFVIFYLLSVLFFVFILMKARRSIFSELN